MKIAQVRRFALSLPQVTEAPHFASASFRVGGKIFITVPPGDEHIHVFIAEANRETAVSLYPDFVEKLFWGAKVWGVRISLAKAKVSVVNSLMQKAWSQKAPKRLVAAPLAVLRVPRE